MARETALEQVARRRAIDLHAVERIASLTNELESLERVRTGTERRVREEMIDALGGTAPHTVVLHPTSLLVAAARVLAAEEALYDARLALDLVPVHVPSFPAAATVTDEPHVDAPSVPAGRSRWPIALLVVIGVAASVLCLAIGVPLGAAVAPAGVAIVIAALIAIRSGRRPTVAPPPSAPPPPPPPPPEPRSDGRREDALAQRTDAIRRIEARLRSARRDWGLAAGYEADPEDVGEVIRLRDPQYELTADLVDASPSARAVGSVHRRTRAEWRVLWASLGRTAPPPDKPLVTQLVQDVRNVAALPDEATDTLRRTENRADRARRRLALEAALGGEDLADLRRTTPPRHDLDDRSLVLVSPFFPLAEQRRLQLRAELEAMPDDVTVVVVVSHESEVPPRPEAGQAPG